ILFPVREIRSALLVSLEVFVDLGKINRRGRRGTQRPIALGSVLVIGSSSFLLPLRSSAVDSLPRARNPKRIACVPGGVRRPGENQPQRTPKYAEADCTGVCSCYWFVFISFASALLCG